MERLDYFVKRFFLIIPTFIGITVLCFLLIQFVPGGPVEQAIMQMKGLGSGEVSAGGGTAQSISENQRKEIEAYYGFDQPFYKRYWKWLVTDHLGMQMPSYRFPNKTAWQLIQERFRVSLIFGITGFLLSYLVCIPLGIFKALRHNTVFDTASSIIVFIGYAIPAFAMGMVPARFCGGNGRHLGHFPHFRIPFRRICSHVRCRQGQRYFGAHVSAGVMLCHRQFAVLTLLLMKNSLIEQINKDYMRTVLAKGAVSVVRYGARVQEFADPHCHRHGRDFDRHVCRIRDH
ncbi:MAG: ABC transporter permease subunit [Desulfobacterales bacterium]